MKKINLLIFASLLIFISCSQFTKEHEEEPLARVYDNYLYRSQIHDIIPRNISPSDSSIFLDSYINKWIKDQLKLHKAELNLSSGQKDVEKQLDEYRASLLIYKYEQNLINQKLDTLVADEEIEKYYNTYSSEYKLDRNIVKVLLAQIPKSAPQIYQARRWYKSQNKDNLNKLRLYCEQNAKNFFEEDKWIPFESIHKNLPLTINNEEQFLKRNKQIESKDSLFYYFLKIKDYKLENDTTPLFFVKNKIKTIIINKRKHQLIKEFENKIYEANKNNFEVYTKKN